MRDGLRQRCGRFQLESHSFGVGQKLPDQLRIPRIVLHQQYVNDMVCHHQLLPTVITNL
jgi:hypothetical protein